MIGLRANASTSPGPLIATDIGMWKSRSRSDRPSPSSTRRAPGPRPSPHVLSRGKVALSIRVPCAAGSSRRRATAVTDPVGPPPTTRMRGAALRTTPSTLAPGQRRGLRSVTSSAVPGMILLLPGAGVAGSGAGPPAAPAAGPAVDEAPAGPAEPDRPDPDPAADPDPAEPGVARGSRNRLSAVYGGPPATMIAMASSPRPSGPSTPSESRSIGLATYPAPAMNVRISCQVNFRGSLPRLLSSPMPRKRNGEPDPPPGLYGSSAS